MVNLSPPGCNVLSDLHLQVGLLEIDNDHYPGTGNVREVLDVGCDTPQVPETRKQWYVGELGYLLNPGSPGAVSGFLRGVPVRLLTVLTTRLETRLPLAVAPFNR